MRTILLLLTGILLMGGALDALGEDLFLGRIVSVDHDTGALSVLLIDEEAGGVDGKARTNAPLEVTIPPNQLPKNLSPGDTVRIWGSFTDGGEALSATRLYGAGHGGGASDATGVRRRIGKGRGYHGGGGGGRGHGGR